MVLKLEFIHKLLASLSIALGGDVAVKANIWAHEENAFKHDRHLKSVLKSSPLEKPKQSVNII